MCATISKASPSPIHAKDLYWANDVKKPSSDIDDTEITIALFMPTKMPTDTAITPTVIEANIPTAAIDRNLG